MKPSCYGRAATYMKGKGRLGRRGDDPGALISCVNITLRPEILLLAIFDEVKAPTISPKHDPHPLWAKERGHGQTRSGEQTKQAPCGFLSCLLFPFFSFFLFSSSFCFSLFLRSCCSKSHHNERISSRCSLLFPKPSSLCLHARVVFIFRSVFKKDSQSPPLASFPFLSCRRSGRCPPTTHPRTRPFFRCVYSHPPGPRDFFSI